MQLKLSTLLQSITLLKRPSEPRVYEFVEVLTSEGDNIRTTDMDVIRVRMLT